jgi:pimeloyl-ACP methyl ester carboxylesterase
MALVRFLLCAALAATPALGDGAVEVDGRRIAWTEAGAGPPLVLLHGGGLASPMWRFLLPEAGDFRVVAIDARGHGASTNPDGAFGYPAMAADAASVLDALGLGPAAVMGYSDGGMVALQLALARPDLVRALVIGGATHRFAATERYADGMEAYFGTRAAGALPEADLDAYAAAWPEAVERMTATHAGDGAPDYWRRLLAAAWPMWTAPTEIPEADLARIAVPALVVLGDRDEFFAVEEAAAPARALPDGRLVVIPGGHAVFRDAAPLFNAVVLDFLRALP